VIVENGMKSRKVIFKTEFGMLIFYYSRVDYEIKSPV